MLDGSETIHYTKITYDNSIANMCKYTYDTYLNDESEQDNLPAEARNQLNFGSSAQIEQQDNNNMQKNIWKNDEKPHKTNSPCHKRLDDLAVGGVAHRVFLRTAEVLTTPSWIRGKGQK